MARRLAPALIAATVPAIAAAAAVVALDRAELVRRSDTIVHGRVLDVTAGATDGPRTILTRVRVQVLAALKGWPAAEIAVVQRGGTLGPYTLLLPGGAHFAAGEEVVLFLRCADGPCGVVGLAQGKYGVTVDRAKGRRVARRQLDHLAAPGGPLAAEAPVDLEALLADVRRLAR